MWHRWVIYPVKSLAYLTWGMPDVARNIVPVRPWHLENLLLKTYFQPQNEHSKAKEDHHFFYLSCPIMHLAWFDPRPQTPLIT